MKEELALRRKFTPVLKELLDILRKFTPFLKDWIFPSTPYFVVFEHSSYNTPISWFFGDFPQKWEWKLTPFPEHLGTRLRPPWHMGVGGGGEEGWFWHLIRPTCADMVCVYPIWRAGKALFYLVWGRESNSYDWILSYKRRNIRSVVLEVIGDLGYRCSDMRFQAIIVSVLFHWRRASFGPSEYTISVNTKNARTCSNKLGLTVFHLFYILTQCRGISGGISHTSKITPEVYYTAYH